MSAISAAAVHVEPPPYDQGIAPPPYDQGVEPPPSKKQRQEEKSPPPDLAQVGRFAVLDVENEDDEADREIESPEENQDVRLIREFLEGCGDEESAATFEYGAVLKCNLLSEEGSFFRFVYEIPTQSPIRQFIDKHVTSLRKQSFKLHEKYTNLAVRFFTCLDILLADLKKPACDAPKLCRAAFLRFRQLMHTGKPHPNAGFAEDHAHFLKLFEGFQPLLKDVHFKESSYFLKTQGRFSEDPRIEEIFFPNPFDAQPLSVKKWTVQTDDNPKVLTVEEPSPFHGEVLQSPHWHSEFVALDQFFYQNYQLLELNLHFLEKTCALIGKVLGRLQLFPGPYPQLINADIPRPSEELRQKNLHRRAASWKITNELLDSVRTVKLTLPPDA